MPDVAHGILSSEGGRAVPGKCHDARKSYQTWEQAEWRWQTLHPCPSRHWLEPVRSVDYLSSHAWAVTSPPSRSLRHATPTGHLRFAAHFPSHHGNWPSAVRPNYPTSIGVRRLARIFEVRRHDTCCVSKTTTQIPDCGIIG